MKLSLRSDLGGYAAETITNSGIDGTVIDKPFVLLTGPNGSGKSAIMRGIRASIGLRGERGGQVVAEFGERELNPAEVDNDVARLATHVTCLGVTEAAKYVPVVFDPADLGWKGQPSYLFDSREVSAMNKKSSFDEDMMYHVSMIAGGRSKASHGQFVSRTWWEALEWAAGYRDVEGGWARGHFSPAKKAVIAAALGGSEPSTERWLFIDEPETAIDSEALLVGLSVLLELAEIGKLRVFCASHSLLFAAGIAKHEKVQVIDMGPQHAWLKTQELTLRLSSEHNNLASIGKDILAKMAATDEPDKPKPKKSAKTPVKAKTPAKKPARSSSRKKTTTFKVASPQEDFGEDD